MKYLVAILSVIVFHITAVILAAISGGEYEHALIFLAIGAISMLTADYYLTKEGD